MVVLPTMREKKRLIEDRKCQMSWVS